MSSLILALLSIMLISTLTHPLAVRSIQCLDVGANATASWTNAEGKRCTWTGIVGSNFGAKDGRDGDYGCIGRCGAGCNGISVGTVYTQECFSHDVCSWFTGVGKDPYDPNCGNSYKSAIDDYLVGMLNGCSHASPSLPVVVPTVQPVCV